MVVRFCPLTLKQKHDMETLEHGMYCEVTREQAVELLTIEDFVVPEWYAGDFFLGTYDNVYARLDKIGIMLSGVVHGDMTRHLQFTDFRQRLINTLNNNQTQNNE